jgi:hypothetical protein
MRSVFETLGMAGIGLSVVAYLPQVTHLAKEHCSAGVSTGAWWLWLTSSLLIGSLAIYRGDFVFIAMATTSMLSSAVVLIFAHRYRGAYCASHRPASEVVAAG